MSLLTACFLFCLLYVVFAGLEFYITFYFYHYVLTVFFVLFYFFVFPFPCGFSCGSVRPRTGRDYGCFGQLEKEENRSKNLAKARRFDDEFQQELETRRKELEADQQQGR